uniref:Utp21 domain-containing protein n=1 Tax=Panagrellus redivivus TaxID=6233 RepID=A0A7E4UZN6_PANRE
MNQKPSNLFTPYKALGLVCSEIPPTYQSVLKQKRLGDVNAAIGNVFVTYRMQPFRRYLVSDALPKPITVLTKDKAFVFAAFGAKIGVFKNNQKLVKVIALEHDVKLMLSFVDILVVVDVENTIRVIDVQEGAELLEIPSPEDFDVKVVMHPATYLNKIVLGGANGEMRLVNIKTGKLVYEFSPRPNYESPITVIEQSTAVDVVAIGHENGRIQLMNLKTGKPICSYKQDGAITAIAFRTDGIDSMATANSEGDIAIWDLEEKILVGQKVGVHEGRITSLYFLRGLSFLISSGVDNKMINWALEEEQCLPVVHTEIAGHGEGVTSLAFFDENALISTSLDGYVRSYNLIRDDVMQNFGKAREVKKSELSSDRFIDVALEPVVDLDVCGAKQAAWDDVICRHKDSVLVSTWSTRRKTKGTHLLYHQRFAKNPNYTATVATSVCLSACGNFAFIGYSSGHIDMFNVQSGQFRGTFARILKGSNVAPDSDDARAHEHPVRALVADLTTKQLISGGSDGLVLFWNIQPNRKCYMKCNLPAGVVKFQLNRFNSLLAVAVDQGALAIVDTLTGKIVRKWLKAHSNALVTALEYSRDSRWLVSGDDHGSIKVWDISTSLLLDFMRCPSPIVALAFNPGGQFLASAHEGERAVFVWANMPMFVDEIDIRASSEDSENSVMVHLPGIAAPSVFEYDSEDEDAPKPTFVDGGDEEDEVADAMDAEEDITGLDYRESDDLYSFSGLPPARWANLADLDAIKERNKPIEPPKKPKHAPFFLPTTETLEGVEFFKENTGDPSERERAIAAKRKMLELETPFLAELNAAHNQRQYLALFAKLKNMSLTAIDFQLRSIPQDSLAHFLVLLSVAFSSRKDLDLVQSYLNAFVRIHRSELWGGKEDTEEDLTGELTVAIQCVRERFDDGLKQLKLEVGENMAILQWIKSAIVSVI